MALNDKVIAGKERLKTHSIATVEGWADQRSLPKALAKRFSPETSWSVKPMTDGKLLVEFPSERLAREVEKMGKVAFSGYSLSFRPWTSDVGAAGRADGAMRWVLVTGLPLFCWDCELVAHLLQPIGDLIYLGGEDTYCADQATVMLRFRRGQLLPCNVECNILGWKYIIRVEIT
ncbi:hypothetical protein J5N97_027669 [Dioscorea zingiberensis]|uniref:DUF4283 domain-containing protein n=1 Tax=Dioscorea zingiberensis TaxID=325984 RepID=A0A9D5BXK8_9LILI|nr:hypothetical protein J5N97_027669 [Dioscorea zingiberensis]